MDERKRSGSRDFSKLGVSQVNRKEPLRGKESSGAKSFDVQPSHSSAVPEIHIATDKSRLVESLLHAKDTRQASGGGLVYCQMPVDPPSIPYTTSYLAKVASNGKNPGNLQQEMLSSSAGDVTDIFFGGNCDGAAQADVSNSTNLPVSSAGSLGLFCPKQVSLHSTIEDANHADVTNSFFTGNND